MQNISNNETEIVPQQVETPLEVHFETQVKLQDNSQFEESSPIQTVESQAEETLQSQAVERVIESQAVESQAVERVIESQAVESQAVERVIESQAVESQVGEQVIESQAVKSQVGEQKNSDLLIPNVSGATEDVKIKKASNQAQSTMESISNINIVEPQIGDYLNYRDFLRAFYLYKREITKTHLRPYNYSFFSAAADIRSPNYLRLVIEGQRNLSEEMAMKFAKAMQLNKESSDEFLLLVLYCQETDPSLRNQYLKNLSDFRLQKSLKQGVIDKKTIERIPNWIGWILYTLIDQEGAQFSVSAIKQLLRNKASEVEIQSALNKLLESGEIQINSETGEVKKGRTLIDNSEDIPVVLIRRLQTQLMYMGLESLLQDNPTEREFGTLTLALNKQEFEDLRFQLRKFRKQIHKDNTIQRMQSKGERVYQLNLQLYPVTDRSNIISDIS